MIQTKTALIEAACSGNELALSQLLILCQPDLARFARRTCSTSEDAEDAVQIALWQLHNKIGTLKTVAAFASWLFRIVERECYRLFRMGRTEPLSALPDDIVASATNEGPRMDLIRSIAALPPAYRCVFVMRDVEEWTTPEVAEQLGLSPEAVKSRLHRARLMIRDTLSAGGYRPTESPVQPPSSSGG